MALYYPCLPAIKQKAADKQIPAEKVDAIYQKFCKVAVYTIPNGSVGARCYLAERWTHDLLFNPDSPQFHRNDPLHKDFDALLAELKKHRQLLASKDETIAALATSLKICENALSTAKIALDLKDSNNRLLQERQEFYERALKSEDALKRVFKENQRLSTAVGVRDKRRVVYDDSNDTVESVAKRRKVDGKHK